MIQLHAPSSGLSYKVVEAVPVVLEGLDGWRIKGNARFTPKVVKRGTGFTLGLNRAIAQGIVLVHTEVAHFNDLTARLEAIERRATETARNKELANLHRTPSLIAQELVGMLRLNRSTIYRSPELMQLRHQPQIGRRIIWWRKEIELWLQGVAVQEILKRRNLGLP